jgi:hypothetical protein
LKKFLAAASVLLSLCATADAQAVRISLVEHHSFWDAIYSPDGVRYEFDNKVAFVVPGNSTIFLDYDGGAPAIGSTVVLEREHYHLEEPVVPGQVSYYYSMDCRQPGIVGVQYAFEGGQFVGHLTWTPTAGEEYRFTGVVYGSAGNSATINWWLHGNPQDGLEWGCPHPGPSEDD